jgi:hypothetical protein
VSSLADSPRWLHGYPNSRTKHRRRALPRTLIRFVKRHSPTSERRKAVRIESGGVGYSLTPGLSDRRTAVSPHMRSTSRNEGVHNVGTDSSRQQELAALGRAVRQLREQRRMSLDDLSSASRQPRERKMSSRRIGRIEAGEVDPHYDEMIALADALDVTPAMLIVYA